MLGIVAAVIVFVVLSSKITNLSREIEILKGNKGAFTPPQQQSNFIPTSLRAQEAQQTPANASMQSER